MWWTWPRAISAAMRLCRRSTRARRPSIWAPAWATACWTWSTPSMEATGVNVPYVIGSAPRRATSPPAMRDPHQGRDAAALEGRKDRGRYVPRQLALAEKQPQRLSGRLIGYGPPCLRVVGFWLAVPLCGVLDPRYCAPFFGTQKGQSAETQTVLFICHFMPFSLVR